MWTHSIAVSGTMLLASYRVEPLVDRRWFLFGRHSRHLWNAFGSLRAAKAAAQADYEEGSK